MFSKHFGHSIYMCAQFYNPYQLVGMLGWMSGLRDDVIIYIHVTVNDMVVCDVCTQSMCHTV